MSNYRQTVILMASVVALATGAFGGISVAIWSDNAGSLNDVRSKVLANGSFDAVDTWDVNTQGVPSLFQALAYDAVLVYGGFSTWTPAVRDDLGNVLADYSDAGRGVVTATFCLGSTNGSWTLGGRFNQDTYHVFTPFQSQTAGQQTLGTVYVPGHPIMAGVTTFDGGYYSYRNWNLGLTPGAVRVADWTDGNPLIGSKELAGIGRRADLNFYPGSADLLAGLWVTSTDGGKILANSLTWAAIPEPATGLVLLLALGLRRR